MLDEKKNKVCREKKTCFQKEVKHPHFSYDLAPEQIFKDSKKDPFSWFRFELREMLICPKVTSSIQFNSTFFFFIFNSIEKKIVQFLVSLVKIK